MYRPGPKCLPSLSDIWFRLNGVSRWHGSSSLREGQHSSPAAAAFADEPRLPLQVGEVFHQQKTFTEDDVRAFATLTGDSNPIHVDNEAARTSGFERAVVQGMLYAGMFPAIIGSGFPGAVYMSQTLRFVAPVLVGEPLLAKLVVLSVSKHRHRHRVNFHTTCHKNEGTLVLDGTAMALFLSGPAKNLSQLS